MRSTEELESFWCFSFPSMIEEDWVRVVVGSLSDCGEDDGG